MSTSIVLGSQHDAARCFTLAPTAAIDQYLPPTPGCGKAATRRCCYRSTGQTDRRTDGHIDARR